MQRGSVQAPVAAWYQHTLVLQVQACGSQSLYLTALLGHLELAWPVDGVIVGVPWRRGHYWCAVTACAGRGYSESEALIQVVQRAAMACERFWLMCRWNKKVAVTFSACGTKARAHRRRNVFHVKQYPVHVSRCVAESLISVVHVNHPFPPSRFACPDCNGS